jgi:hypothetical protein
MNRKFWEEIIACVTLTANGKDGKRRDTEAVWWPVFISSNARENTQIAG